MPLARRLTCGPQNVDLKRGILVIVGTKFGKSCLVPIHASTRKALADYARERYRAFRRDLSHFYVLVLA